MTPQEITQVLATLFGAAVQSAEPESWQVEMEGVRLLVLLSEDGSWLRSLVSIASAQEAEPYLHQLMEANFDDTQETRYAIFQDVLWGVFQHSTAGLTVADFQSALSRLLYLQQQELAPSFNRLAESQIRQIITAAKQRGDSLESTMQALTRFYEEGVMGVIDANAAEREQVLGAWRYQLERLWEEE